jgi:hypothetical protein
MAASPEVSDVVLDPIHAFLQSMYVSLHNAQRLLYLPQRIGDIQGWIGIDCVETGKVNTVTIAAP